MTEYKFKQGDKVTYRGVWGTGVPEEATITSAGMKNDEPVYGLSDNHWCYEWQIQEEVVEPKDAAMARHQVHIDRDEWDIH